MLAWRLSIGIPLIVAFIAAFYFDHTRYSADALVLLAVCLLLSLRCVYEMVELLHTRSLRPSYRATALCTLAVVFAAWSGRLIGTPDPDIPTLAALGPVAAAFCGSVLVLFVVSVLRYREPGAAMESLGAEILTVGYIGVLLAVTAQLRWVAGHQAGYLVLGSMIVAVKSADTGAYFAGRFLGKKKMAPRLSPGKTWMGALGALLAGAASAWAWLHFATPLFGADWSPPAWYFSVLYGVVLAVAGLFGDLCESLIKRDVEKKDAAKLMPGFGGLLDLLDSILVAGPVALLLWELLPLASWLPDRVP